MAGSRSPGPSCGTSRWTRRRSSSAWLPTASSTSARSQSLGTGSVQRLFADTRAEEEGYYAATAIFPIVYVIVIRRAVYEANRWLARELLKAFTAAKQVAYDELARTAALSVSLPFVREEHERAVALMGPDYWSYGLEANKHVLSAFARYAASQHLIGSAPEPEDLFVPETGEEFVV